MKVAICVCTFRRPKGLEKLLAALAAQVFAKGAPEVQVVVVENEAGGPGQAVCETFRPTFPFELIYGVQTQRGIPFARNMTVALAGEVDFLAFIDDDEYPAPQWLSELIAAQREYDVDLVSGPVFARYEQEPPAWIAEGRFHDTNYFKTGQRVMPRGTNNTLVRKAAIDKIQPPFDERLALVGHDDGQLFFELERLGCSAVYTEAAIAYETTPPSRCTWGWFLRRDYRIGIAHASFYRQAHPRISGLLGGLYRGLAKIAFAVTHYPKAIFTGKVNRAIHIRSIARGAGMIAGNLGFKYDAYRKTDGK